MPDPRSPVSDPLRVAVIGVGHLGRHHARILSTLEGVTPQEVFDFVLDPAQYIKADTKMLWATKLGDIPNGMIAREDGKLLTQWGRHGRQPGQFKWVHNICIDSKGALYTSEVGFGRRVQKFTPTPAR